jgi:hypothetical protein
MYPEAITSEAKIILERLKAFPEFYLAGGTALALQIGHRISVDFDFFQRKPIPKEMLSKIEEVFKGFDIEIIVNQPQQLTVLINGMNVSFIEYPFPMTSILVDYSGIEMASPSEIAAMKAYAIGRRATLKDYIDLYFIIKNKIFDLKGLVNLSEKKYGKEFNTRLFLEQLVYSKDIENIEIRFLKGKVSKDEIEKFFEQEVGNFAQKI